MGVEHYLVCKKCKQFIDLHKAYGFSRLMFRENPPSGAKESEGDYLGGYWDTRGIWFMWKHINHGSEIEMHTDCEPDWYDKEAKLDEVYSHSDDLKLRDKVPPARESDG